MAFSPELDSRLVALTMDMRGMNRFHREAPRKAFRLAGAHGTPSNTPRKPLPRKTVPWTRAERASVTLRRNSSKWVVAYRVAQESASLEAAQKTFFGSSQDVALSGELNWMRRRAG